MPAPPSKSHGHPSARTVATLCCLAGGLLEASCTSGIPARPEATSTNPPALTLEASSPPPSPPGPGATPTPTVGQWLGPYTLAGLRQRQFQDAKIVGREEIARTDWYTRYAITYLSDGLRITGTMQIPIQGKPPFPAIIMNHGYFNRIEYRSGDGTDRAAEYLNRHGYLTVSSDYRSWGGSDSGPSLFYSGLVTDVANLISALKDIPEADSSRIGIWGHSMGGGVTMKVLTLGLPIKAGVLYSTVSADDADILARWGLGCIGDIAAGEQQLGCNSSDVVPLDLPQGLISAYYSASLDATTLALSSPIHHLEWVTAPVQIHYGTEDGKDLGGTPPEWSRKLYEALAAAGRPAEIFAYEGEKHSFVGDPWVALMERTAHFYDEHVKASGS